LFPATLGTDAYLATSLTVFFWQAGDVAIAEDFEKNRPIDTDSRRNRANRGSSKFVFEIKK